MPARLVEFESLPLFVEADGAPGAVAQILRLTLRSRPATEITVEIDAEGVAPVSLTDARRHRRRVIDVPVAFDSRPPTGDTVSLDVTVSTAISSDTTTVSMLVHEPGRTIHLVPHFHMDPVWWNTQAATIDALDRSDWSGSPRMQFQRSVFDILRTHIERAESDAAYRFCVAEVDYLAPLWTHHPDERARLQRLLDEGRVEVVGATYNEPNGTLTSAELTRRNLEVGTAFQRGVLGQPADTSWQLDVFGHDPQFPSLLGEAGVETSVWARGPFGPWGPMLEGGFSSPSDPGGIEFPTEFEWIAPDGNSVACAYLAAHYSSGYRIDGYDTIEEAARFVLDVGSHLGDLAATSHAQLLVGTDLSPPARWITDLPGWFAERYAWPKVRCSLPREFLAAMRDELGGRTLSPQSRDMNPVYTGKDVSYIDTKQAQRDIECALVDAEIWSTIARRRDVAEYPRDELDEAWRLLVYGAHHDAITGTESDQAYLELLAGWRRAHHLAHGVGQRALERLAGGRGTGTDVVVTVFDPTLGRRTDSVLVVLDSTHVEMLGGDTILEGLDVVDDDGSHVPFVAESVHRNPDGRVSTLALRVVVSTEGVGRRLVRVVASPGRGLPVWTVEPGTAIDNGLHRLDVDPDRGGCVTSWRAVDGEEMLVPGGLGNELVVHDEYADHPTHGEGPWHLSPTGVRRRSSHRPATVRRETSPIGQRLIIAGTLPTSASAAGDGDASFESTLTVLDGVDRVDVVTTLDELDISDELVRLDWAVGVPGALPVVETGETVIGRGFAFTDADAALHPWTLDSAATNWFASSVTARVDVVESLSHDPGPDSEPVPHRDRATESRIVSSQAIGIAELVVADWSQRAMDPARRLVVALAASGVTTTTTVATGNRYGRLGFDSNAPDVRIAVGIVGGNPVAEAAIARLPAADREAVERHLAEHGRARAWVPARQPLADVWRPSLDVTDPRDLALLVVVAVDEAALHAEVDAIVDELADHRIVVETATATPSSTRADAARRSVAFVNTGTPSCAVTTDGVMSVALVRSSTGWPSGQWIDPPRRSMTDGSSFQLQHWTHRFVGALVARAGDWRDADIVRTAHDVQHRLDAVVRIGRFPTDAPSRMSDLTVTGSETPPLLRSMSESQDGTTRLRTSEPNGERAEHRLTLCDVDPHGDDATGIDVCHSPYAMSERLVVATTPDPTTATGRRAATDGLHDGTDRPPIFSRWWSQGRGPLQRIAAPVAVHLRAPAGRADTGWTVDIGRLSSHLTTEPFASCVEHSADVTLEVWTVDGMIGQHSIRLDPDGARRVSLDSELSAVETPEEVRVIVRGTACDGRSWAVYDEVRTSRRTAVVLASDPLDIELHPGRSVTTDLVVANRGGLTAWVELDVLCPWGTWDLVEPRHVVTVAPDDRSSLPITFTTSSIAHPGTWWWGVRLVAGPTVAYSPTAHLEVSTARAGFPSG